MQASTLENQKGKDEIVTVMVFKDHLASRSFRIPVKWFSNLGLIVGAAIIIGVVSFFFAVKFFSKRPNGRTRSHDRPATKE